jgi:hypothetical protein
MWPTPDASTRGTRADDLISENGKSVQRRGSGQHRGIDLQTAVNHWPTPRAGKTTDEEEELWKARNEDGKVNTPPLGLAVKMWNTPNTMDALEPKSQEALDHEHESARPGRSNPNNLRDQIAVSEGTRFWPTPSTQEIEHPNLELDDMGRRKTLDGRTGRDARSLNLADSARLDQEKATGSLNPDWVEQHLMSLPEGWTRLEPIPDGAYQEWFDAMRDGTWWDTERGLPRVTTGAKNRVNRLRMLGNGIVPATLALFLEVDGK